VIEVRDVRKMHNSGRPNEFTALAGVSLRIEGGGATVIKGPSGSGKTSLLTVIGCMARPTSGRVFVEGREVTSLPERYLTEVRRRTFGFVFQQYNLIRGITALENAMVPAYPTGEARASIRQRALSLFTLLGIGGRAGARVEWLSGGEMQRVAIARALINSPRVLIADEPTAHLDTRLSLDLMGIFAELARAGTTLIITSHDPLVTSSPLVGRSVEMRDGAIVAGGAQ
jgi:putative ABC transport system ATP-binding protein